MSAHKHFGIDFYPTPESVLQMMDIDCSGKICLEPSAGKGDIVKYLKLNGASQVFTCEIEPTFRPLLQEESTFIKDDFLKVTSEEISRIQCIIMNPPFSAATKHILHAWSIAPPGCEISALCNYESERYNKNRELTALIDSYGLEMNLGPVFAQAERLTNVNIGLVKLFKPADTHSMEFEGFHMCDDEPPQENGILPYDQIKAIVNSYVATLKVFDKLEGLNEEFESASQVTGIRGKFSFEVNYNTHTVSKTEFLLQAQKHCWNKIINITGATKYVTASVQADMDKFMSMQVKYPFTVRNVYRMLEVIFGTREQTLNKAIVTVVDDLTRHTHENRYGVPGWKTNDGHMLNKKFIINYCIDTYWTKDSYVTVYGNGNRLAKVDDLVKALCFLTGTDYGTIKRIDQSGEVVKTYTNEAGEISVERGTKFITNQWYDYAFFECKFFKKGTGHFKFKDLKVWELLNRKYAALKGQVLPEKI